MRLCEPVIRAVLATREPPAASLGSGCCTRRLVVTLKKGSVEDVCSESNGLCSTRGGEIGLGEGVRSSPEKFPVWCWFAHGKQLTYQSFATGNRSLRPARVC